MLDRLTYDEARRNIVASQVRRSGSNFEYKFEGPNVKRGNATTGQRRMDWKNKFFTPGSFDGERDRKQQQATQASVPTPIRTNGRGIGSHLTVDFSEIMIDIFAKYTCARKCGETECDKIDSI